MSDKKKPSYSQGAFDPKHPLITQSFLNLFSACPYAAFRRYVEGDIIPPGVAALQGTATDAAVTFGAETLLKEGRDASLADKKEVAAETFDKKKDEHQFFPDDEKPNHLKDETVRLVELHHREIAPTLNPVATQVVLRVEGPEYDLAGTIDIVDAGHVLRDTKTANKSNKYPDHGFIQKELYWKLYKETNGVEPSEFKWDVLVKTKTPKSELVSVKKENNAPHLLDHIIHSTMLEFANSMKTGVWRLAENGNWRCASSGKWCGYLYNGCPKGKAMQPPKPPEPMRTAEIFQIRKGRKR